MSAAAIIVRQNRYINAFADAGATSPQRATSLEELGQRDSWIFRRMVASGVFVPEKENRFSLEEAAGAGFIERRRRLARDAARVLLLIFVLVMYFASR